MNGGSGSDFGVIGGSRTPNSGRVSSSMAGIAPPTRANSFSVADKMDQRVRLRHNENTASCSMRN